MKNLMLGIIILGYFASVTPAGATVYFKAVGHKVKIDCDSDKDSVCKALEMGQRAVSSECKPLMGSISRAIFGDNYIVPSNTFSEAEVVTILANRGGGDLFSSIKNRVYGSSREVIIQGTWYTAETKILKNIECE